MVDDVRRDTDIRFGVIGEHGIAAIGVACTPGEIAAGHVDLDAVPARTV